MKQAKDINLDGFDWGQYYEERSRRFTDPLVASEYITPEGKLESALIEAMTGFVIEHLAPVSTDRFLEIGCGCGVMLSSLADRGVLGPETSGIDVSPGMIEKARLMVTLATFEVMDAASVGKLGKKFDKILLWGVLHYLDRRDYVTAALRKITDVLRPGGKILLGWVPDADRKDDYVAWRKSLPAVDHSLRTPRKAGLEWLWFEKAFFRDLGNRYPASVEILEHRGFPGGLEHYFFSVLIRSEA